MSQDKFDELLAELNNVVAGLFGYAELLAKKHRPDLVEAVREGRRRYRDLVERLRKLNRSGERQ
jgi:nitrogen-specific signal transduction histidine kinase